MLKRCQLALQGLPIRFRHRLCLPIFADADEMAAVIGKHGTAAGSETTTGKDSAGAFTAEDAELFRAQMLTEMAAMSVEDGLVMQLHPGSFRNHNAQLFARFGRDYADARTVRLGRNYRSSGTIVAASAALMGRPADARAVRPAGEPVALHTAASEEGEAAFVVAAIEELMGGHDLLAAGKGGAGTAAPLGFGEIAVLYRSDGQSAALRQAFDRAGIPFKKSTPAPIVGHAGVVGLLAALADCPDPAGDLTDRLAAADSFIETARPPASSDGFTILEPLESRLRLFCSMLLAAVRLLEATVAA